MKKTVSLMFIIIFSLSFCLANDKNKSHYVYLQNPNDLINPQGFYEYIIIKNDHLSHLAYKFYLDGLKWTKIYKANSYILDPNWIYPDNWLVIPDIFSDENGYPITKRRSFTYKSIDSILSDSATKNGLKQDNDEHIQANSNLAISPSQIDQDENGYIAVNADTSIMTTNTPIEGYGIVKGSKQEKNDNIDRKSEPDLTAAEISGKTANKTDDLNIKYSDSGKKPSYSPRKYSDNNPNWVIGLFGGYPFVDVPDEEDNLNYGLLIGTPLRITVGSLCARLGGGYFGIDFTNELYPGAGVLLNIAISELLKFTTPLQLQVHGTGFYVPGGGIGSGVIGSASAPLGKSPFNIGLYIGIGEYNSDSVKSNWNNTGIILQLQF